MVAGRQAVRARRAWRREIRRSKELFGLGELAGLLEGPAQEPAALFAFLFRTGLLQHGLHGFLDRVRLECDIRQGDDDLPDLTVDKVGFARVHPPAAGENPGPAFHADGVLDVLVLEAEHLDPEPVRRYDLRSYANRRWHGVSVRASQHFSQSAFQFACCSSLFDRLRAARHYLTCREAAC